MEVNPPTGSAGFDRRKKSMIAANVIVVSMLAVILAVFLNYGLFRLGADHDLRLDFTRHRAFSLEDATKSLLREIEAPVDVYVVYGIDEKMRQAARPDLAATRPDSGLLERHYRPRVADMALRLQSTLEEARQYCPFLRVHVADADQNVDAPRDWARKLGLGKGQLVNHLVIVDPRADRKKSFSFYQLFQVDLGGPDPTRGHVKPRVEGDFVEQYLLFGLKAMTRSEEKTVVYFASGHQEIEVRTVTSVLSGDDFEVRAANLGLTPRMPPDCDLLMIVSPAREWRPEALEALVEYVERGGRVLLTQGRYNREAFAPLLERFGVEYLRVQVGHPTNHVQQRGKFHLYGLDLFRPPKGRPPHPITEPSVRDGLPVYLGFSRAYRLLPDYERDRITRGWLARTGESAELVPWVFDGRDWRQARERPAPQPGDYPMMLALEIRPERPVEPDAGRMVLCGSDEWLSSDALTRGFNVANMDVLLNSVYWLTDKETLITGTPRTFRGALARLDDDEHRKFRALAVWALPILILLVGLLVALVRRS